MSRGLARTRSYACSFTNAVVVRVLPKRLHFCEQNFLEKFCSDEPMYFEHSLDFDGKKTLLFQESIYLRSFGKIWWFFETSKIFYTRIEKY